MLGGMGAPGGGGRGGMGAVYGATAEASAAQHAHSSPVFAVARFGAYASSGRTLRWRLCAAQYSHPSRGGERLCELSVRHCLGHSKGSSVQSRRCRHAAFGRLGGYSTLHSYHPLVMQARDEQPKRGGGGAFMAELNKKVGK